MKQGAEPGTGLQTAKQSQLFQACSVCVGWLVLVFLKIRVQESQNGGVRDNSFLGLVWSVEHGSPPMPLLVVLKITLRSMCMELVFGPLQ